ncbi:hypothetical protein DFR70_10929 [Nocardia tenerifensis]|uniref:Uncharacterized protein n=1 Tax=Nocardia tenerifensis TaxID=228006 RepID=A0A318JYV6_9NOCA|nr:hypothetical protein DFR70_10929 [Nocardia tenerifensis]
MKPGLLLLPRRPVTRNALSASPFPAAALRLTTTGSPSTAGRGHTANTTRRRRIARRDHSFAGCGPSLTTTGHGHNLTARSPNTAGGGHTANTARSLSIVRRNHFAGRGPSSTTRGHTTTGHGHNFTARNLSIVRRDRFAGCGRSITTRGHAITGHGHSFIARSPSTARRGHTANTARSLSITRRDHSFAGCGPSIIGPGHSRTARSHSITGSGRHPIGCSTIVLAGTTRPDCTLGGIVRARGAITTRSGSIAAHSRSVSGIGHSTAGRGLIARSPSTAGRGHTADTARSLSITRRDHSFAGRRPSSTRHSHSLTAGRSPSNTARSRPITRHSASIIGPGHSRTARSHSITGSGRHPIGCSTIGLAGTTRPDCTLGGIVRARGAITTRSGSIAAHSRSISGIGHTTARRSYGLIDRSRSTGGRGRAINTTRSRNIGRRCYSIGCGTIVLASTRAGCAADIMLRVRAAMTARGRHITARRCSLSANHHSSAERGRGLTTRRRSTVGHAAVVGYGRSSIGRDHSWRGRSFGYRGAIGLDCPLVRSDRPRLCVGVRSDMLGGHLDIIGHGGVCGQVWGRCAGGGAGEGSLQETSRGVVVAGRGSAAVRAGGGGWRGVGAVDHRPDRWMTSRAIARYASAPLDLGAHVVIGSPATLASGNRTVREIAAS